ncbi:MAG: hypothetical protein WCR72_10880, partial [Bacteroidota bacterium]
MKIVFLIPLLLICNVGFSQKSILDKGFKNKDESNEMVVMIINLQTNSLNQPLTQAIADVLKNSKGYNTNPSFFNTEFIKNGDFEKLYNAAQFKIKKLHLKNNLDYMCLGKYQIISITKNEYNMFTADVTLQLNIIDVKSGAIDVSTLRTPYFIAEPAGLPL